MAPAARILKAIQGFLTVAMKSITACGSLHQELSCGPTASFSSGRGRGVVVVRVKGLLVEVHVQFGLLALDNDAQVVGGDAGDALLGLNQLDGLADLLKLTLGEQDFGGVARDVDARGALINRLLDLGIAAAGIEADLGKPLHFAAALPVVEEL